MLKKRNDDWKREGIKETINCQRAHVTLDYVKNKQKSGNRKTLNDKNIHLEFLEKVKTVSLKYCVKNIKGKRRLGKKKNNFKRNLEK